LNRTNFKEKHTTGMFINTAALRIKIEENIKFTDFVKNIAQSSLSMLRYQKYPYEMLLENLRKKQSNLPTLYDVMLSYQITKANDRNLEIPYEVEWVPTSTISNGMYIHLHDNNDDESLNIAYDYQIEKYDIQDIDNMHKRILHIIEQVLENENCLERDIEIVTEEEKNRILNEFNATYVDYPKDKTIAQLFEEQVEKTPDNIAVVCGDKKVTYRELNEKANSLAQELLDNEIKAGDTIAIRLNRSIDMIISIFACVKAEITYTLIENTLPKERVQYILKDSNSKAIITINELNKEKFEVKTILLDTINIKENKININRSNYNERLCIIYTSGSTGNPKGVLLRQRGFNNLVVAMKDAMNLEICNSFISHASVSFDMFAFELYCSVLNGKTLYLTSDLEQKDPISISNIIIKNNIDFLLTTPSKIELILSNDGISECLSNIKVFLLGGEVFTSSLYNRMRAKTKGNIYNGYGPTEITACCSIKKVEKPTNINIGKPVNNAQIYILDSELTLAPIGIVGELCVAGDGLAEGYINNKERTEKSFINVKGLDKKVYRTGDLARYNNDGEIEYIGRNDFQVKLHGQRIELGEIEKNILKIENIKNACVCIKEVQNREILSAYYTANKSIDKKKIKRILEKELPQYMIPAYFLQLDEIPLTINGKIDRKKLPTPILEERKKEKIEKPKTEIEEELLEIYKKVLNFDKIDINDNFFEIGGDSLAAINLTTHIYEKMKIKVNIKNVFENPTIKELSQFIVNARKDLENAEKILKVEDREYYPTSSAQKRIYFASSADGNDSILYNISGGLILEKMPNIEKLNESFKKLINNNESLRTHFEIKDGELIQKIEKEVKFEIDVEIAKNSNIEEITKEFIRPFDLSKAPLMRVKLVSLNKGKAFLLIDMHHIISDGVSMSILTKEVSDIYNGKNVANKEIDYKDFSIWENNRKDKLKKQEKYWVEQFKDSIPVLELPTEFSRPAIQSFEGNSITKKLNKEVVKNINNICQKLNVTPYMLLISVYYIILSEYSATNDIIIGTPVACRKEEELLNIIGMFVNTLPLRNKIDQNETFYDFLNKVKENCLQAFENEEYQLDSLINKLNIQRNASRNSLFEILCTKFKYSKV
jgi:amino acid adenylation domain-containing protein